MTLFIIIHNDADLSSNVWLPQMQTLMRAEPVHKDIYTESHWLVTGLNNKLQTTLAATAPVDLNM